MGRTSIDRRLELVLQEIGPSLQPARFARDQRLLEDSHPFTGIVGQLLDLVYSARRARADVFVDQALFGEPAWDILLELAVALKRGERRSISALCASVTIPVNTTLRWVQEMITQGYLNRETDWTGVQTKVYIGLTDDSLAMLLQYFDQLQSRFAAREILADQVQG